MLRDLECTNSPACMINIHDVYVIRQLSFMLATRLSEGEGVHKSLQSRTSLIYMKLVDFFFMNVFIKMQMGVFNILSNDWEIVFKY